MEVIPLRSVVFWDHKSCRDEGRSGKLALYIFGGEIARDSGCVHPLSPRLFEKWRGEFKSAIFPLRPLTYGWLAATLLEDFAMLPKYRRFQTTDARFRFLGGFFTFRGLILQLIAAFLDFGN
jgi:hypothetical protein